MNVDDVDSFETMHSKVSKRYFLKYDFLQVVRAYLQTKTGSAERKSFVEKRHELVANIAKVSCAPQWPTFSLNLCLHIECESCCVVATAETTRSI